MRRQVLGCRVRWVRLLPFPQRLLKNASIRRWQHCDLLRSLLSTLPMLAHTALDMELAPDMQGMAVAMAIGEAGAGRRHTFDALLEGDISHPALTPGSYSTARL